MAQPVVPGSANSFEEAFLQACWLACHLLWGDRQGLGQLMATSPAPTPGGLWPRYLLL